MILSEALHVIVLTLSGLMVDYQSLHMGFTDCHSSQDIRTIHMQKEILLLVYEMYSKKNL